MSKAFDIALGGRLGLRSAARQLLEAIDKLAEHELLDAGYTRQEVAALESIASWRIDGVPFRGVAQVISFKVIPHTVERGVEVVEVFQGARLMAVIYPGAGPKERHINALRIVSRHLVGQGTGTDITDQIVRFSDA